MKFKYLDNVKIISGFYEGHHGQILEYKLVSLDDMYIYLVSFFINQNEVWLHESQLESR